MSVWNRDHQVMPNGTFTTYWNGTLSHYQGPVFVPYPGKDDLYYLFHEHKTQIWNGDGDFVVELHYSVIDRTLDGGRGDIVVKDQPLYANTTEATAAVTDATGKGYWMVTHKANSDSFVVYHVGSGGLDLNPTYYKIGSVIGNGWRDRQIVIKFSPDRKKMVITRNVPSVRPNGDRDGGFDLYQFDDATGAISQPVVVRDGFVTEVPNSLGRYFSTGADFSPNSRLLYVSSWDKLFQFDVSNHDYTAINNSRVLVGSSDFYSYGLAQLLLASNGKIYMTKFYPNEYLGVIKNPDVAGIGCGVQNDAVYFPNATWGVSLMEGLGNCVHPYLHSPGFTAGDLKIAHTCLGDSTLFTLPMTNVDSVKWSFGDPVSGVSDSSDLAEPKHYYASQQEYTVTSIVFSTCVQDTIEKTVTISHPSLDLGSDKDVCQGLTLTLKAAISGAAGVGATYMWQDGSTLDSLVVSAGGKYKVVADYKGCTVSDSVMVNYLSLPAVSLGNDISICTGDSVMLSDPHPPGMQYKWQDGSNKDNYMVKTGGKYWLEVTDGNGCSSSDTVQASTIPLPYFSLGKDTILCTGQQVLFNFNTPGVSYQWDDGSTGGTYAISQDGSYWLNATQNGCSYRDSLQVTYKPMPAVYLGQDTLLCTGATKLLTVQQPYTSVLWSNGVTGDRLLVTRPDKYSVKVNLNGCIATDTVVISYHGSPQFSLGNDTTICEGTTIVLNPGIKDVDLRWQDNSMGASYTVTQPGLYSLTATNICGSSTKEIHVVTGACMLVIPNAFTPNGDGHNDVFRVKYPEFITTFRMVIFNRWGQQVFESTDARHGWSGYFNGQAQPSGTYVWTIYYQDVLGNKQYRSGTVQLIR